VPDDNANMSYVSDVLLRRLAGQLAAQGMEIRECRHGPEIVEITVTNPRDPDRGRVVMGYDGYLTWERWSDFLADSDVDRNADVIRVLLTNDIARPAQASGQHASPQSPGPCRSG
jgi:hypothetical protein